MTVLTFQVRMFGDATGCKEVVAMELEKSLRQIGWAEVRCISSVEEPEPKEERLEGWRG